TQALVFERHPDLEDLSHNGDQTWSELTTPLGGMLWVKHNDTYSYPWGISMFHGLHCLQMIRTAVQ
ncbi:hypothetical protein GE09DRAFT_929729, partial [Coniochaeta sp. 2T2.1]